MEARVRWSLLWQSLLLLPMGAVLGLVILAFPALIIALPCLAGFCFVQGSWIWGLVTLGIMIPLICVRRWVARMVAGGAGL